MQNTTTWSGNNRPRGARDPPHTKDRLPTASRLSDLTALFTKTVVWASSPGLEKTAKMPALLKFPIYMPGLGQSGWVMPNMLVAGRFAEIFN